MAWQRHGSSKRRLQMPPDWPAIRRTVIARDQGLCVTCGQPGRDVDHINDPQDHSLANLRLLCFTCHNAHTQQQATQGRAARAARSKRRSEPNPGLRRA